MVRKKNFTKSKILFLVLIPLFLYIALLSVMPLMEPDEARYSDIASLMNRTGDYITPHLKHVIYLEKPPLCYWTTALFFKLFGENEFSSRLLVALCAWGCIFLVYRMGVFFHDEKTGLYSAGVLSTCVFFSMLGRINILDMPLTFFVCLATWAGYRYFAEGSQRRGWLYLLYFGCGLAFLTKGLIGIVFPFAILFFWLSWSRRWRDLFKLFSPVGLILFLLVTAPWIILVQKANHDFLWFFFIREHFLRYTTTLHARDHSLFFYLPIVVLGMLPWSAFLPEALKGGWIKKASFFKPADRRFLLTWFFFILIFFSVSSSKLIPYIIPVFLPLALMFGRLFKLYENRDICPDKSMKRRFLYHLPVIIQFFAAIIFVAAAFFIKNSSLSEYLDHSQVEKWWWMMIAPACLLGLMVFLPSLIRRRWPGGWFLTIALLSSLFMITITFPVSRLLTPSRSAYPLSRAIQKFLPPGQELFQFGTSLYGIDFYNKIRTPMIGGGGELDFGIRKLSTEERSRYFPSPGEFIKYCKEKGDIYCIIRYKKHMMEMGKMFPSFEILWHNEVFCLVRVKC